MRDLDVNIFIWYSKLSGKLSSNTQNTRKKNTFESAVFEWISWCCNRQNKRHEHTVKRNATHSKFSGTPREKTAKWFDDSGTPASHSRRSHWLWVCTQQEERNGSLIFFCYANERRRFFGLKSSSWLGELNGIFFLFLFPTLVLYKIQRKNKIKLNSKKFGQYKKFIVWHIFLKFWQNIVFFEKNHIIYCNKHKISIWTSQKFENKQQLLC